MIKVTEGILNYLHWLNLITRALKSKLYLAEVREIQSVRVTHSTIAGGGHMESIVKTCGQLLGAKTSPSLTAIKKQKPQSYKHKELNKLSQ